MAPLVLGLDPLPVEFGDGSASAAVSVRVFDLGVISIALHFDIGSLGWSELVARLGSVQAAVGPAASGRPWVRLLERVRRVLAETIRRPASKPLEEDYILAVVNAFDTPLTAAEPLDHVDLVPLLSGERRVLAESSRKDLLRHCFSYYTDDLVALGWDRAFLHEPRGESDVIDIIEVANAQLLEMRYYNDLLDAELPRMREAVEAARRATSLLKSRRYTNLARRLFTVVADVTELTERVDNALLVTKDVYLARVYAAALDIFGVHTANSAVDRKLAVIRDTHAALNDEASGRRGEWLEIAVVVLILLEVVVALWR